MRRATVTVLHGIRYVNVASEVFECSLRTSNTLFTVKAIVADFTRAISEKVRS